MLRFAAWATLVALASPSTFAQPNGGGPGPVLGIVEIPDTFTIDEQAGRYVSRAAVTLFTRPDSDSKVAMIISSPEAIDAEEYGYEEGGAIVYARDRGFYLIRTNRGMGWLEPRKAGPFHSYEEMITDSLTYLTEVWDGFLSASPGTTDRTRLTERRPYGPEDVKVSGFRTVAGKLWIQVDVVSHTFCESQDPVKVKARGWIPAHDQSGAPTVWFSSRGC